MYISFKNYFIVYLKGNEIEKEGERQIKNFYPIDL